jgi:hypothetical protein
MNWALLVLLTITAACALLTCSLCSSTMMKAFMKKLLIVIVSPPPPFCGWVGGWVTRAATSKPSCNVAVVLSIHRDKPQPTITVAAGNGGSRAE